MATKAEQRLDIFPHIFPREFFDRMKDIAAQKPALAANIKRWLNIPVLWDLDARIKMMRKWPGYQQVLTLSLPAIEFRRLAAVMRRERMRHRISSGCQDGQARNVHDTVAQGQRSH